jgi:hypothetical protein
MIQQLNIFVNFVLFIELLVFFLFLFGRKNKTFNKLPEWEIWLIKVGIATMCCGALFSALAAPVVIIEQFIRNFGTMIVFGWAILFHWKYFMKKKK